MWHPNLFKAKVEKSLLYPYKLAVTEALRREHDFYVHRCEGAKIYSVDHRAYTDFWCGRGTLLLGHTPNMVLAGVSDSLLTSTYGEFYTMDETRVGEFLKKEVTEGKVVAFFNSLHDFLFTLARDWGNDFYALAGDVVYEEVGKVWNFRLVETVEEVNGGTFLCSTVRRRKGLWRLVGDDFFAKLKTLKRKGVKVVLDESLTFFKVESLFYYKGLKEDFSPDVLLVGGGLAGGFPLWGAVFCSPIKRRSTCVAPPSPLSVSAAQAVCDYGRKVKVWEKMNVLRDVFLNSVEETEGFEIHPVPGGVSFSVPDHMRLVHFLFSKRLIVGPEGDPFFFSYAHTEEEVKRLAEAVMEFVKEEM